MVGVQKKSFHWTCEEEAVKVDSCQMLAGQAEPAAHILHDAHTCLLHKGASHNSTAEPTREWCEWLFEIKHSYHQAWKLHWDLEVRVYTCIIPGSCLCTTSSSEK